MFLLSPRPHGWHGLQGRPGLVWGLGPRWDTLRDTSYRQGLSLELRVPKNLIPAGFLALLLQPANMSGLPLPTPWGLPCLPDGVKFCVHPAPGASSSGLRLCALPKIRHLPRGVRQRPLARNPGLCEGG